MTIQTPTVVRKSIVTKSVQFSDSDRLSLAQTMSHKPSTAKKYYRAKTEATTQHGYDVIGEILELPSTSPLKKQAHFTVSQTEIINNYFSEETGKKIMPTPPNLEGFLPGP